jgi:hypothetical protein
MAKGKNQAVTLKVKIFKGFPVWRANPGSFYFILFYYLYLIKVLTIPSLVAWCSLLFWSLKLNEILPHRCICKTSHDRNTVAYFATALQKKAKDVEKAKG